MLEVAALYAKGVVTNFFDYWPISKQLYNSFHQDRQFDQFGNITNLTKNMKTQKQLMWRDTIEKKNINFEHKENK